MVQPADRQAFAERMRLQLQSRYRGIEVVIDRDSFALQVTAAGAGGVLPLTALHQACLREPARTATLIAGWVSRAERQLSPRTGMEVSPARLLWCVRAERYLEGLNRAGELVTRQLGAGMVAFIAEELPGSLMRGLPISGLEAAGLDVGSARERAGANTRSRFAGLSPRIRSTDRVPADGWRLGSDTLFQGSVITVPEILAAFAERTGGDVLLAVPDRSVVLAIPASGAGASRFQMRVVREWREAMNPVSRDILVTDGSSVHEVERRRSHKGGAELLGWLRS